MMKKWFVYMMITIASVLLLVGCGTDNASETQEVEDSTNNEQTESENNEENVVIVISENKGETTITEKEIAIEEGAILLDVMKDNFEIEEQGGFINSIDGKAPAEGEEKSWMYFLNDEMGPVGVAEYELNHNDHVVFDLQAWE